MRVLNVIGAYFPATAYGGPVFCVQNTCQELVKTGRASVHVFTTDINGRERLPVVTGVKTYVEGVAVSYYRTMIGGKIVFSLDHAMKLYQEVGDYDIAHLNSVFSLTTLYGAAFCRMRRIPYIVSPHGSLVPELIERRGRWRKKTWIRLLDRKTLEGAYALHVTSENEARNLERLKIRPKRIEVIPNGVEGELFSLPPLGSVEVFRRKIGIDSQVDIILFLGRISWEKGLDILVQACGILSRRGISFVLVLAGPDPVGYRAYVEWMVSKERLNSRVIFTGQLSGSEKKACIAASQIVVLPSLSENFGIAAAEGMAMGKPVVVTEGVGIAPDVRECAGGDVVPFEVVPLAEAIGRILGDWALACEMGARAASFAKEHYSWPTIANRMLRLYEEVVEDARR
jgi:glycosyltransferase involved in cell wall biosynthesis